jgi:hypothetical protein
MLHRTHALLGVLFDIIRHICTLPAICLGCCMISVYDDERLDSQEFPSPPVPSVPIHETGRIPACSGVYFAYVLNGTGWQCVYVGESKLMRSRLMARPELAGCTLGFLPCDASERKRLECFFIAILNPRLNCQSVQSQSIIVSTETIELVRKATEGNAQNSKSGKAHYVTTARACKVRPKTVRAAWKSLQKSGVLRIDGDFAVFPRHNRWQHLERTQSPNGESCGQQKAVIDTCPF